MPLNPSTAVAAVASYEQLHQAEGIDLILERIRFEDLRLVSPTRGES
ncbi:hypothetical protein [Nostoc sp.]